jgi:DNA replication protein DnaC
MSDHDDLRRRLRNLNLLGLLEHWDDVRAEPWLAMTVEWEEEARRQRSLDRRLKRARLGRFKPMSDFEWTWPTSIDRRQVEDLFNLDWVTAATNVTLVGPNGVGKTMIARNLAHQAVLAGHTVKTITASELLNSLAEIDSSSGLTRRLRALVRPQVLVIDELGYLSYDNRHADLLFEVVSRRYELKPILVTTNRPFAEWNEVFPSAASVTTIVDRFVHRCEIVKIQAESYRLKEGKEAAAKRARQRRPTDRS